MLHQTGKIAAGNMMRKYDRRYEYNVVTGPYHPGNSA
jgi:hypothetical protein